MAIAERRIAMAGASGEMGIPAAAVRALAAGCDLLCTGSETTEEGYLAVVEAHAVVGECDLGAPTRRSAQGWALPVTRPRRYRAPRPLSEFGLAKIPRSFRYIEE